MATLPPRRTFRDPRPARAKTTAEKGYNGRWQRASREFRQRHPLCVECLKVGRATPAQCVDHIKPHKVFYLALLSHI